MVSKVDGESSSNAFTTIAIYSVQLYLWALTILSLIYLGDMLEWACRGCKWQTNETEQLGVVARAFDPFKFREHTECSICLTEFDESSMVTVLPCDVRHYFHAKCIQDWSRIHTNCPLCKANFTLAQIREFNSKLTL